MAIGERIRFLRNLRGMTQKYLGTAIGFPEKTATFVWHNMSQAQELQKLM